MTGPAKTENQQGKGRFKPGQSGNPKGRPAGSKHRATLAAMALLEGDLEAITQVAIDAARGGDLMAVKLILDKILPNAKDRHIDLKIPKVDGVADLPKVLSAILKAVGQGVITPQEGQSLAAMIEAYRRGIETADLEARLTTLEEWQHDNS